MYKIIDVNGVNHVLTEQKKHRTLPYHDANYRGSGMCLCGVLNKNETLDQWMKRTNKLKSKNYDSRSKKRRNDSVGKPVRQRKKHLTAVS